jgi:hypothetical protein
MLGERRSHPRSSPQAGSLGMTALRSDLSSYPVVVLLNARRRPLSRRLVSAALPLSRARPSRGRDSRSRGSSGRTPPGRVARQTPAHFDSGDWPTISRRRGAGLAACLADRLLKGCDGQGWGSVARLWLWLPLRALFPPRQSGDDRAFTERGSFEKGPIGPPFHHRESTRGERSATALPPILTGQTLAPRTRGRGRGSLPPPHPPPQARGRRAGRSPAGRSLRHTRRTGGESWFVPP